MKPLRVSWRPAALEDRVVIMDYIARDSPLAAIHLDNDIEAKAGALLKHPMLYKAGRVSGTREMV